jgi:aspartyl-tRNA synthetase
LTAKAAGQSVVLSGWVHRVRDHGGLLFVDLRDNYGITQCVFGDPADIEKVHPESVIRITGAVVARAADQINPKLPTGGIEIKVEKFDILSAADPLPFQVFGEDEVGEDIRYKYRFLDLRRETLHKNILLRNKIMKWLRDKMWSLGFSEFQTPILTVSSPEGARDFLVPSRLHHGQFYALPQAPQQFKQLLQIAGFDKYFQIAPCMRDEDLRADRMLEFYQLDIEMSFVEQSDVHALGDEIIPELLKAFRPDAKIAAEIPHIAFDDAMLKYGTDKPDLRNPILISDVSDIFAGSDFGIFANAVASGSVVRAVPAPKTADKPRSWFDKTEGFATEELGLAGLGYIVFDAAGAKGPVAKKLDAARVEKIKSVCGLADGDSVFFICEKIDAAAKAAGKLRARFGEDLGLIDANEFRLCWIEDFPFFEADENAPNGIAFGHNPFSRPQGDLENLDLSEPMKLKAWQYDMVLNGHEICSGGLRNYSRPVMLKLFEVVGLSEDEVKTKFGGLYSAFGYGVPPHGGCAFGLERIISQIVGNDAIREQVAFPANQRGQDLLMGSPSEVSEQQLRDAHIQVRKK